MTPASHVNTCSRDSVTSLAPAEMEGSMLMFFLAAVALTSLWGNGAAQNFQALNNRLLQAKAYEVLFADESSRAHLEEVKKLFDDMKSFWFSDLYALSLQRPFEDEPKNISAECNAGAAKIMNSTDPSTKLPLVVRMVDAMGKIGPGYLDGNFIASGSYDECLNIGPGDAEYCTGDLSLTINSTAVSPTALTLTWHYGMCVPRGCTPEDIVLGVETVTFGVIKTSAESMYCVSYRRRPFNAGAIIMIIVCFVFVTLVVGASAFDILQQRVSTTIGHDKIHEDVDRSSLQTQVRRSRKNYKLIELITAFSLLKVIPQIVSTKQPPSAITSINGLRVISMLWVILGHTHLTALVTGLDNIYSVRNVLSRFTFQAIGNAYFAVDSFFVLSGLLVAYLSMRQMKRKNGRFPFLSYYLHRYLRLTPTYAFVLFFIWLLTMHFTDGPNVSKAAWEDGYLYQNCKKYWWTNLLYINNLYPWKLDDECINWSWYLANDMQFYILAPLIIIPLYFLFPLGLFISGVVIVISMLISGVLAGVYDHQANQLALYAYDYQPNTSDTTVYDNLLYIKPWHRVAPYVIGLVLGFILYRLRLPTSKKQHLLVKYAVFSILWVFSAAFLFSTVYGLYSTWHGHLPTKVENVSYITFSKVTWSLGLAFLIGSCHYGCGGPINQFLSMKVWIPLSRLSYNAYLLHPFILMVVFGSERKPLYYQDYNLAIYFIGVAVLSYGAAAVVSVFVEFPIGNLEQVCFKMAGIGGRESARTGGEEHQVVEEKNNSKYQEVDKDKGHDIISTKVSEEKSPLLPQSYKTNQL